MRKFCILAVLCLAVTASCCKKEDNEQPCPGPEVSYVANAAEGEYYARKFSKGDEYCYCVRVTAVGYDAWGLVDAWNENLSMLLYSAESYSGKGDIKIPAGTYRIGAAGETEAGTVSRDESYFRTVESDGDNSTSYYFEEGEVTVSYSGEDIVISGSFVDKSCVVRRFSYEGPCYVWNYAPDQNIEASYFYCDKRARRIIHCTNTQSYCPIWDMTKMVTCSQRVFITSFGSFCPNCSIRCSRQEPIRWEKMTTPRSGQWGANGRVTIYV